jgi:hypothetical protein
MSKGACIAIGIVTLFFAFSFAIAGGVLDATLPGISTPFDIIAAVCGVVALACLVKGSRPLTVRLVGAAVCGQYVWYVVGIMGDPLLVAQPTNIVKAVLGLIVFGIPGAYVAITGRYPSWGRHAHVFRGDETNGQPLHSQSRHDHLPG